MHSERKGSEAEDSDWSTAVVQSPPLGDGQSEKQGQQLKGWKGGESVIHWTRTWQARTGNRKKDQSTKAKERMRRTYITQEEQKLG